MDFEQVLELLRSRGALPLTRVEGWPCLTEAVIGSRVAGSWWGHPKGGLVYAIASALEDHPDVVSTRLVSGKVTFVHRDVWPALFRVATDPDRSAAAIGFLSGEARRLLELVRRGPVRLDEVPAETKPARKALSEAATALEQSLLVMAEQLHTEKGRHTRRLQTFESWVSDEVRTFAGTLTCAAARARLGIQTS